MSSHRPPDPQLGLGVSPPLPQTWGDPETTGEEALTEQRTRGAAAPQPKSGDGTVGWGGQQPHGCTWGDLDLGGTNPGGTNPDGTNPSGTNSGRTNLGGTNPDGTNSGGTNPGGTGPGGTDPSSCRMSPWHFHHCPLHPTMMMWPGGLSAPQFLWLGHSWSYLWVPVEPSPPGLRGSKNVGLRDWKDKGETIKIHAWWLVGQEGATGGHHHPCMVWDQRKPSLPMPGGV